MTELTAARIQGSSQEQDLTGTRVTLDWMFTEIQGEIELALGKDKRGWPGLRFDAVIRLHDVLLSLRHWGDDVRNEVGVLNAVEGYEGDIGLATTIRSSLEDIVRDVGELRHYYKGEDRIKSTEIEDSLMEELENSVECLRAQVEPLRTFFDAKRGSGFVTAVRKAAISWKIERHKQDPAAEITRGSPGAEQNAASSLAIQSKANPSASEPKVPPSRGVEEVEVRIHSVANTTPEDYPDGATMLSNLGNKLLSRYERTGNMDDLEAAISNVELAISATPEDHPERPKWLQNLGIELFSRYERNGNMDDLETAILRIEMAVSTLPQDHPDRAGILNNLGNCLGRRFERTGSIDDLNRAVEVTDMAVNATPQDHPDRASRLSNLGNWLGRQFELTSSTNDLKRAIETASTAIDATPQSHPDRAAILNKSTRAEYQDSLALVNDAISTKRDGLTTLHVAAEEGHEAVVKHLLEYGVEPDSKDTNGLTPLSRAATNGHEAVTSQSMLPVANSASWLTLGLGRNQFFNGFSSVWTLFRGLLDKGAEIPKKGAEIIIRYLRKFTKYIAKHPGIISKQIAIENPQTAKNFKHNLDILVNDSGLRDFFPDDSYLEGVAAQAAMLITPYDKPDQVMSLVKLALYQPILYCDDSGSMGCPSLITNKSRMEAQIALAKRIVKIITEAVPSENEKVVHLGFINKETVHNNLDITKVEEKMDFVPYGGTALGKNLRTKILQPLLYDVVDQGARLARPLFILIITDGAPEEGDTFENTIRECGNYLLQHNYAKTAVRFFVSQVGNDKGADGFLRRLSEAEDIKDVLHCTTEHLDEKFAEFKANERGLDNWLLNALKTEANIKR